METTNCSLRVVDAKQESICLRATFPVSYYSQVCGCGCISGLDATTAMHLLSVLSQLAEGGRSVITTIHQPSSRLYQQLDTIMLLSEGRTMYYGDAKLVLGWFSILGKPVPLGVNIADFILDLSNGNVPDDKK